MCLLVQSYLFQDNGRTHQLQNCAQWRTATVIYFVRSFIFSTETLSQISIYSARVHPVFGEPDEAEDQAVHQQEEIADVDMCANEDAIANEDPDYNQVL